MIYLADAKGFICEPEFHKHGLDRSKDPRMAKVFETPEIADAWAKLHIRGYYAILETDPWQRHVTPAKSRTLQQTLLGWLFN